MQELRKKLIQDGKFQHLLEGGDPDEDVPEQESDVVSPVLMEVLQASARVSVPDAARQRVWELCAPLKANKRCTTPYRPAEQRPVKYSRPLRPRVQTCTCHCTRLRKLANMHSRSPATLGLHLR